MSQPIADEYLSRELTVKPGDKMHRLVAMLFDTYYDDLTEERIGDLEATIENFRWMNASGKRL